ncbi:coenzyme PQQ biosynthesis protein C [Burkholderia sp. OAS925]
MNAKDTLGTTPGSERARDEAWTREEFEAQLRAKGTAYHIHHPFNVKMNSGGCSPEQIRGWVANRFYYQINIPLKDAAVMSNCPDRETRRRWVLRILDHDGYGAARKAASKHGHAWAMQWASHATSCGRSNT